jgi:hypothetical protein
LTEQKCTFPCSKIEIKYGFEYLEEMNNFLHRNFLRFRMDLELKFMEVSSLEFDRIYYSFFLKLWIWVKLGLKVAVSTSIPPNSWKRVRRFYWEFIGFDSKV